MKDAAFKAFEPLIGKWKGNGEWMDGNKFEQEVVFEFGLNKAIIKSKTYDNISRDSFKYGLRNEGINAWSEAEKQIKFWEFDIFGGITSGSCRIENKDIYYDYLYDFGEGPMPLTDAWLYIDDNSYTLKVGVYKDGKWEQTFLSVIMNKLK
jgi:hypothetical protein